MHKFLSSAATVLAALMLPACTSLAGSGADIRTIGSGPVSQRDVAMTADYRLVIKRKRDDKPVSCSEPSPDLGRIVSAASDFSFAGSAKGIAKVQPEVALALATSRSESLAQLGQRLATIQLLRDSTFRACEAYANGAISGATYAMIISRYDDVMVTLLLGEIAGGGLTAANSARLLGFASRTGLTSGTGDAVVAGANQRIDDARATLQSAQGELARTQALAPAVADRAAQIAAAQAGVKAAEDQFSARLRELTAALQAVGQQSVGASVPDGGPQQAQAAAQGAQHLTKLAKDYLDDADLDAIVIACLSSLSHLDQVPGGTQASGGGASNLQDECRAGLAQGRTIQRIIDARMQMMQARLGQGTSSIAQTAGF